jgi:hypothetical protein
MISALVPKKGSQREGEKEVCSHGEKFSIWVRVAEFYLRTWCALGTDVIVVQWLTLVVVGCCVVLWLNTVCCEASVFQLPLHEVVLKQQLPLLPL